MVIGAALAWVVAVYVPSPFVLPEHLVGVDMYSPPELQQELAEKEDEIYWKSGLFHLVLMGLCFGVVPLFMAIGGGTDKPAVPAIAGLVSGAVFGAAAFGVGHVMRTYANNAEQGLQGDMLVFILVGILLSLRSRSAFWRWAVPEASSGQSARRWPRWSADCCCRSSPRSRYRKPIPRSILRKARS